MTDKVTQLQGMEAMRESLIVELQARVDELESGKALLLWKHSAEYWRERALSTMRGK